MCLQSRELYYVFEPKGNSDHLLGNMIIKLSSNEQNPEIENGDHIHRLVDAQEQEGKKVATSVNVTTEKSRTTNDQSHI